MDDASDSEDFTASSEADAEETLAAEEAAGGAEAPAAELAELDADANL